MLLLLRGRAGPSDARSQVSRSSFPLLPFAPASFRLSIVFFPVSTASAWVFSPGVFWPSDEQPVVDVSERIRHEGLALVVPPFSIHDELVLMIPGRTRVFRRGVSSASMLRLRRLRRAAHPGGKLTTTTNTPGCVSSGLIGMVSTHRVKEPHKCTWKDAPCVDEGSAHVAGEGTGDVLGVHGRTCFPP